MKKGYTLIEILFVMLLLSFVIMISFSLMGLNVKYVFKGASGFTNRTNYLDVFYNMLNDIQSCEYVNINNSGKELELKYLDDISTHKYIIEEGYLKYDDAKILNIDGGKSSFSKGSLEDSLEVTPLNHSINIDIFLQRSSKDSKARDLELKSTVNVRNMGNVKVN